MADRSTADELAVEAVEQEPRGLDVHGVAHREHAPHARLNQPRGDRAENIRLPQGSGATGVEDDERNRIPRQQVAETIGRDEVGPGTIRAGVRLLETERARFGLLVERAVAVEVDEVVGLAGLVCDAEHFLHPRQIGRPAELDAHPGAERIECVEQRLGRKPRVEKACIRRPADYVQDAERQCRRTRRGRLDLLQLPPHRESLCQASAVIGHELPGQPQQRQVGRGNGQLAGLIGREKPIQEGAVPRGRK